MGLGAFPASDPRFLRMLGMHGTLEANLATHHADLVVCVGATNEVPGNCLVRGGLELYGHAGALLAGREPQPGWPSLVAAVRAPPRVSTA
jgi:hypothetical protein